MIGWLLARVALAGAAPEEIVAELEIPDGVRVSVTVVGASWRFVVDAGRTRTLDATPPTTDEERATLVALVESLFADLRIPAPPSERAVQPPPAPLPVTEPVVVAVPVPVDVAGELMPWPSPIVGWPEARETAPRPVLPKPTERPSLVRTAVAELPVVVRAERIRDLPSAEAREPRSSRHHPLPPPDPRPAPPRAPRPFPLDGWLAADAAVRPGTALAAGGSVGFSAALRPAVSVGLAGSVHPRRSLPMAAGAWFGEAAVDAEVGVGPVDWLTVRGGAGLVAREYHQHGERIERTVMPRSSVGADVGWRDGPWGFAVGGLVDADLGRILLVDDDGDEVFLSPVSFRPVIRVEFRTPKRGADIGDQGRATSGALQ